MPELPLALESVLHRSNVHENAQMTYSVLQTRQIWNEIHCACTRDNIYQVLFYSLGGGGGGAGNEARYRQC